MRIDIIKILYLIIVSLKYVFFNYYVKLFISDGTLHEKLTNSFYPKCSAMISPGFDLLHLY